MVAGLGGWGYAVAMTEDEQMRLIITSAAVPAILIAREMLTYKLGQRPLGWCCEKAGYAFGLLVRRLKRIGNRRGKTSHRIS